MWTKEGTKKQAFTETQAHRDDWLHRGEFLADVDYYHYSRYFERIEQPRSGTAQSFQKNHGRYFLFDSHYPLSRTYVQVLRRVPKTVQNVGPSCQRSEVNNSEENSAYKAFFHSCTRCTGAGQCANPLIYQPLLWPRIEDIDKHLAVLEKDPTKRRHTVRFAPAWKARCYEMNILARRGHEKHNKGKRIGVVHDTTTFKQTDASSFGAETKMQQMLIQQVIRAGTRGGSYLEPIIELTMHHLGVPLPWHPEQPHIAEWQACSTREILMHLDGSVDARNVAQKQAAKHKSAIVHDPDAEPDNDNGPRMYVEDLGGARSDIEGDEDDPEDGGTSKYQLRLNAQDIKRILTREAERKAAEQPGRHKDMHTEMLRVAEIFGRSIDNVMNSFPVQPTENKQLGASLQTALDHQKQAAEQIRRQQESAMPLESMHAEAAREEEVRLLTEEATALLQNMDPLLAKRGPIHVAEYLVTQATLNKDQRGPVALLANDMHEAWIKQGCPTRMRPVGRIARMLLVGGGGCGKSRIINLVLTALFTQFWGPRGCVKVAPSNKAARGILGKTLHVASKLSGCSLTMTNLRCSQKLLQALEYLWVPCGAYIIDEAPQGASALYHAVALRSSYGRAGAYQLELANYAHSSQSFGAIPIGVECGDELQLPPVPASAGLFADTVGATTEHLAGLELFKQKDYVYRLRTMKRFSDEVLISILTKMRKTGGSKLTPNEWKALKDTDITRLSREKQQERLEGTEMWYQAAPTWATVAMAQVIRARQSAIQAKATLYMCPATDHVLNRPDNLRLNDQYLAEQISAVPNMNNTGRLPSIGMWHIGMQVRLTNTVEAPEAVTDSTGIVIGIDPDPMEESTESHDGIRLLRRLPTLTVKLDGVETKFLPPCPCLLHQEGNAVAECKDCDFKNGCIAIQPQLSPRAFLVEVKDPGSDHVYTLRVKREQLPVTNLKASTIHTLQGTTTTPGLIFHWKFPRFFSEELRWLATYVALSRPPSLQQLISVGLPLELRNIIEAGPPDGILTRFKDMFDDKEQLTHSKAEELLRKLGWDQDE